MLAPPQLRQLLYISTAVLPGAAMLDDILSTAQQRNALSGVTGMLLFNGRRFLQVLEGPQATVEMTFARISVDPRHRAAVVLSRRDVADREFGSWSMGYRPIDADCHTSLIDEIATKLGGVSPNLRAELLGFAQRSAA